MQLTCVVAARGELADVEGGECLDVVVVGHVENPEEGVQPSRGVVMFLVHHDGDLAPVDGLSKRQDGMGRLRKGRVIVVRSRRPGGRAGSSRLIKRR